MKAKRLETSVKSGASVQPKLLTREDVAKVLGVTYQRVCQLHRQGKLRPVENPPASLVQHRGFLFRREEVERLRDARNGASGSSAAAAFEIFANGGGVVDVVTQLHIAPEKAMTLHKAYATATNDVFFPASLIDELKRHGFDVTRENLAEVVGRMLAGWRASMAVIRRHGLQEELKTIEQSLRSDNNDAPMSTVDPIASSVLSFDPVAFRKALRTAVPEINRRDRHDGLVPIGKIRRMLAYLGLNRSTFDAALLEEERAYIVDLKIANDPTRVKDPEEGISIEGRGLLYFVVLR
jgi:hypothetical protein